jgi:hypothetical protein
MRPASLACLLLVLGAAPAAAEPRRHDGLYVRFGVGPGYALSTLASDADSDGRGASVNTELAAGWTVRPRLVIGGGTFPMVAPAPSWDGADPGGEHVSATGPFAAYWLDDGGGLQLQAGVLFAAGFLDGSDARDSQVGFGYAGTLGVGYDRFVADQWSVGGLARVTAYRLYGVEDSVRIVSPALLVTLTYH